MLELFHCLPISLIHPLIELQEWKQHSEILPGVGQL